MCKLKKSHLGGRGFQDGMKNMTENLAVLPMYKTAPLKGWGDKMLTWKGAESARTEAEGTARSPNSSWGGVPHGG